jgi:hypothetical protein
MLAKRTFRHWLCCCRDLTLDSQNGSRQDKIVFDMHTRLDKVCPGPRLGRISVQASMTYYNTNRNLQGPGNCDPKCQEPLHRNVRGPGTS